jgi:hypothetical protein
MFQGNSFFRKTLKTEPAWSSEKLILTHRTMECYLLQEKAQMRNTDHFISKSNNNNSVPLVRELTIPTGESRGQRERSLRP